MKTIKRQNQQTLGEAIKLMFSQYKMNDKLLATSVEFVWYQVMGDAIKKYTQRIYVKHQILYVQLRSPELKVELSYGKSKIIEHINVALESDYLTDIVFL